MPRSLGMTINKGTREAETAAGSCCANVSDFADIRDTHDKETPGEGARGSVRQNRLATGY